MIENQLFYNDKIFKQYDSLYYISNDGDVYSKYKKGLLKHNIDIDGYHRVDIHGKHMKIHRLVYMVWKGEIPKGKQVNHYDDDKNNNYFENLYLGNQKENIQDCIRNSHRVGRVKRVVIFDKELKKRIVFSSVKEFIKYSGHSVPNGSITKCEQTKWFKERFEVIEEKSVETIESYNELYSLENKALLHEASRVA